MPPSVLDGLLNWPSAKLASRAGSRGPTANTICRCNFRIPGFCSSAVGILIVPTQASILSRCRAPRCDRRPVMPKRNLRKRLENNLRTSGEKIVTRYNPTSEWTARQLLEAFPWDNAPRYLLRDRDRVYGEKFCETAKSMGIREVLAAPRSPWQNPFAERLLGSIRRECLDHVIVFHEAG